jgi:hypothetical protein
LLLRVGRTAVPLLIQVPKRRASPPRFWPVSRPLSTKREPCLAPRHSTGG